MIVSGDATFTLLASLPGRSPRTNHFVRIVGIRQDSYRLSASVSGKAVSIREVHNRITIMW